MEKLVLIDGNSLINRAFYAMPILSTKDGVPTNAVYGFMNMFFKMIGDIAPTYVAVAFDLKAPTFRHKLYNEYKGTRKPMPEELRPQIPLLKELLKQMNVAVFEKEGFEADDIIGTIAKATKIDTVIYTGDRDSFQLVDSETSVYFTKRGISDIDIFNNDNFQEKTGILPYQIIELKALMGDASDNIPGVSGVGEKTALTLIKQYANVENLYNNIDELSGKLKEKIVNGKESCFMSKTLATIDQNVPIDTNVDAMRFSLPLPSSVKQRFIELEFKSLFNKKDLFLDSATETATQKNNEITVQTVEYKYLDEINNLDFSSNVCFAMDSDAICVYDIDKNIEHKFYIRKSLLDEGLEYSQVFNKISSIFSSGKNLILFNKKDTRKFLIKNANITVSATTEDLSLIKYLVDFRGSEENISDVLMEYNGDSNVSAFKLYSIYLSLKEKLKESNAFKLYYDIELPISDVLFDMEQEGFKVDIQSLTDTGVKYQAILKELDFNIKKLCDEPTLNINSPKQLGEVLFEKLKIGKGKKTKTGYSTSAEILEELIDTHQVVPLILRYRQIQKLYSTYIEGFKPLIDKTTGLIHTCFNQTITATGRLSSKEPNLQNIPVRDGEGKELRKFFVPKNKDGYIIGADYSQIELRLLAAFSNCQPLIDAFNNNVDIHKATASKVFNVPLDKVTAEMRRNAKAVNFGVIYGMSEYGLAKNLKISPKQAKDYIVSYFNEYPEVKTYMDSNVEFAKQNGYAVTLFGRRRYIGELKSPSFNLRAFGERVAMNMPLQGSAADIIKVAMINVAKRLKKEKLNSKLILQVHDELILDVPFNEREIAKQILKEEMENATNLSVKLTVEVEEGKTWFDAK